MAKTSSTGRIPPTATPGFDTKGGVGVRRVDKFQNSDVSAFGALPAAAQKFSPQGSSAVEYGPSSGAWSKSGRATTKPQG
jgi:hypothetical protein